MDKYQLAQRLEALLSEDLSSVLKREANTLESKIGSLDKPFLLFGAGNLGRKVFKKLDSIGKRPVAFIDNNSGLWGSNIHGVPVISPVEAASRFNVDSLGVIVTIWFGEATDQMSDRISPLLKLGFHKIAQFGHLAWMFPEEFLPYYCLDRPSKIINSADKIREAFSLLSDDESRKLFVDHIEWRLFLDYDCLPSPSSLQIYFNNHYINYSDKEVLYDIGAFTGDSVASFLKSWRGKQFGKIHTFEPSQNNFGILQKYVNNLGELNEKVIAHQIALGDRLGEIQVESENGPSSRVGLGSQTVFMTTIDQFTQSHEAPTFIKIDIEGFEIECLKGAERVISSCSPVVAVSVYHLQSHIWEIILQLNSYCPDYNYSLCPHVADGWDLVLYAVPVSRQPS